MRARHSHPSASRLPLPWTSWKSLAFVLVAISPLVSLLLLIDVASRREEKDCSSCSTPGSQWSSNDGQMPHLSNPSRNGIMNGNTNALSDEQRKHQQKRQYLHRQVLSVGSTALSQPSCVPQTVSPGICSNEARKVRRALDERRETCAFDVAGDDVVFGVWHSLATEARLQPLLDTWGSRAQIVLLASSIGVRESKLFKEGKPGSRPHLLDTGVEQDDYFSTLGKAFIGLRLMLEAYPGKKWFVILGDDNYVLMENYVNLLSAFDPDEPLAMSRMVFREKFGCKVAGGASIITSRAMTTELLEHLEPWYRGIVTRSGGDVNKAREEDKFHDIAFQKLVEHQGFPWVHLDELPHEPPGYYFDGRPGVPKAGGIPDRSALFHYVPGQYMHYLHFASSQACTCALPPVDVTSALSSVAIGVYSVSRRLSKLDEKRISTSWGKGVRHRTLLKASGRESIGMRGDLARLEELLQAFPTVSWLVLVPVDHFVVAANLAVRIRELDRATVTTKMFGARKNVMVCGMPPANLSGNTGSGLREDRKHPFDYYSSSWEQEGAMLVSRELASLLSSSRISSVSEGFLRDYFAGGDRQICAFARTLSSATVYDDAGLVGRLPGADQADDAVGCPATFPMDPDLADLKPEFTMSEGNAVSPVTDFLLRATPEKECVSQIESGR